MSDYERHKGSIEKVLCDNLEKFAKKLIDTELPEYYDNYVDMLMDDWEDYGYYVYKNELYRIIDEYQEHSNDIFNYEIKDGKIEYLFSFYNGGTCLSTEINEVLDNLSETNTDSEELEWKEDIDEVSYSDDFWCSLTNGYIDLDELLVDNPAKEKLKEAIRILEDFESELTSQDFFEET